jgi:hypothetical protein
MSRQNRSQLIWHLPNAMTRVFEDEKNNHYHYHHHHGIFMRQMNISKVREKNSQLYLSLSLNKMQNEIEGGVIYYCENKKSFVLP